MKDLILAVLALILLTGCVSKRCGSDETEEAVWHCVRRGSWYVVENSGTHSWSTNVTLVLLRNETGKPLLFDLVPKWREHWRGEGVMCRRKVYAPEPTEKFVDSGRFAEVYIEQPLLFRQGAVLELWERSPNQTPMEEYTMYFDFREFRHISGEELRSPGVTTIRVTREEEGQQARPR